jgi:hypothetical protein
MHNACSQNKTLLPHIHFLTSPQEKVDVSCYAHLIPSSYPKEWTGFKWIQNARAPILDDPTTQTPNSRLETLGVQDFSLVAAFNSHTIGNVCLGRTWPKGSTDKPTSWFAFDRTNIVILPKVFSNVSEC